MIIFSICHGMGLLDRAFMDAGFTVIPLCEIDPRMRTMHRQLCGTDAPFHDIQELLDAIQQDAGWCGYVQGIPIIGGPPCQAHSRLRAIRDPKFPDLTLQVVRLINLTNPAWYLFENVVPIDIPGSITKKLDAMHFGKPHQSRPRWFTFSPNLHPPKPKYHGDVDDLLAYSICAGRIYGPRRGAVLQGYSDAAKLDVPCKTLQLGLANAVSYHVGSAWAEMIKATIRNGS